MASEAPILPPPDTTRTPTSAMSTRIRVARRVPTSPHPSNASLPPFRPPPLTPSIGIRTRSSIRDGPPGTGELRAALPKSSAGVRKWPGDVPQPWRREVPRPLSPKELPERYKAAERRVRSVIIALPIVIVTSWVLWERLVKGEERKVFVKRD